jgi:hypothetical protein
MREPFHTLIWKAIASVGYNDSWSQVDPEVLEKFAELIIQECRKVITDFDGVEDCEYVLNPRSVRWDCDCEIRDYFGLEEEE